MNKFYNAFRLRFMLICMATIFLVIASVHAAMYLSLKNIIIDQLGLSAQSTATSIAGSISYDIDGYKRFMETKDVESAYYKRMQEYFRKIKASGRVIKFIYTERPVDEDTVEFLLDAETIGSPGYSAPGDTTFMDAASRTVYDTGLPAQLKPTLHPEYGTLLGGCAPIIDRDGSLLGLVGVNLEISEVLARLNTLHFTMLFVYAVIFTACWIPLRRYSGLILEPMVKDKLTGAYSKRYYETLMRLETRQAMKNGTDLAVMMLDLDHFKKVNDTHGHAFGDCVLEQISKIIMSCLRAQDYFIRYGGEEFVVIISGTPIDEVLKIAERIRVAVENAVIFHKGMDITTKMTISLGVSHLRRHQGGALERELLEKADKALYDAKVTRNSVSLFKGGR